jgi:hypothetical protein
MVPGNHNFDKCIEFSDPYRIFWGPTAYKVTQVLFFLCAMCLNVAAIVDTAEVVDSVLGLHANSYAVSVDQSGIKMKVWSHASDGPCTHLQSKLGECDPFADTTVYGEYLLTLGYVLTAAVFLPLCLQDLKENTHWQIFGFGILMTLSVYFCYSFWDSGKLSLHHASVWGHEWSNMLGVIMFNFALVLAIPAWLHEKKESVSAVSTVVYSTAITTALYIGVGALGGLTISHVHVNLLTPMVSGAYGQGVQVAASIFAFFIIGLDIPLFSVLTRYNLTHSGLCTTCTANLLVVWIPWGLAWIFYQGDAIGELLDWSGTLLTSAVAFILPLYLALRALVMDPEERLKGSVTIYRSSFLASRKAQIMSLYVLLFIAAAGVMLAIISEILVAEAKEAYLHSDAYLNATDDSMYDMATTHRFLKGTTSLDN